jgi:phage shock protein A
MALLERVSTLIRANLNDLVDKAEDPEKMIKQVILDMQNQLLQVKTQVAIAIADQHLLEKKQKENEEKAEEWTRKAELAVSKTQDDLARAALDRSLGCKQMAQSFAEQVADQHVEVENLKTALHRLGEKLAEAQAKADLLVAQHRRARVVGKAQQAHTIVHDQSAVNTFERMKHKVERADAINKAREELEVVSVEDRFAELERAEQVERLLTELKSKRA